MNVIDVSVKLLGLVFLSLGGNLDNLSARIIFVGYILDCVVVFLHSKKHSL